MQDKKAGDPKNNERPDPKNNQSEYPEKDPGAKLPHNINKESLGPNTKR